MDSSSGGTMSNSHRLRTKICSHTSLALLMLASLLTIFETSASDKILTSSSHNHLSWTHNLTRYDFLFDLTGNLENILTLETDSNNYLTESLTGCRNHSACLFRDGKLVDYLQKKSVPQKQHLTLYESKKLVSDNSKQQQINRTISNCDRNNITILHYCSTHWNPPAYLYENRCSHTIEWHSPSTCHSNSTNYERPCFLYDPEGELIDLTPLVKSDGLSYKVTTVSSQERDSHSSSLKGFYINVCNEAHDMCGPNVSSCFMDSKQGGLVDAGYNNLTSIKFDAKENKTVILTSQGQIKEQCEDSRFKTVVRFVCKAHKKASTQSSSGPRLLRSNGCENVLEWETIHACPLGHIKKQAMPDCKLSYEPLGIDIDIRQITKNVTMVEVPNIIVDLPSNQKEPLRKDSKTMILGICKSLDNSLQCGGKKSKMVSACLVDAGDKTMPKSANNSQIIGSIIKSTLRLADDRLYLESSTVNQTCSTPAEMGRFNVTKQMGVRLEFYCSTEEQNLPSYLGFYDCNYVLEWGSPLMCFESLTSSSKQLDGDKVKSKTVESKMGSILPSEASDKIFSPKPVIDEKTKAPSEQHMETLDDASKINEGTVSHNDGLYIGHQHTATPTSHQEKIPPTKSIESSAAKSSAATDDSRGSFAKSDEIKIAKSSEASKMNPVHKFFMITLIIMSLAAFLVVILVLDKKTRLRIPLGSIRRQTRQSFQAQPVPYSRVVNDLDL